MEINKRFDILNEWILFKGVKNGIMPINSPKQKTNIIMTYYANNIALKKYLNGDGDVNPRYTEKFIIIDYNKIKVYSQINNKSGEMGHYVYVGESKFVSLQDWHNDDGDINNTCVIFNFNLSVDDVNNGINHTVYTTQERRFLQIENIKARIEAKKKELYISSKMSFKKIKQIVD